jgi:hypothetical protein
MLAIQMGDRKGAISHVRFTPNSDRESGFPQTAMSALPPKADMCSALAHVCFGPEADMAAGPRIVERWERLPASFALDDASLSLGCQPSWVA